MIVFGAPKDRFTAEEVSTGGANGDQRVDESVVSLVSFDKEVH